MTKAEAIKEINRLRRQGGKWGDWYFFVNIVEGKTVEVKGYKTWLQICRINGLNLPSPADIPVSSFNAHLEKALDHVQS
jgi:hypothetical protein